MRAEHEMKIRNTQITRTMMVVAALALTALVAIPAVAADTVTLSVNGGARAASVSSASLEAVDYSHEDQTTNGTISLLIDDGSASLEGWNVTLQAGDFVAGERSIPASNFSITAAQNPALIEGTEIDASGGPKVPGNDSAVGSLASPRKVLQAEPEFGDGSYQQDLNVQLTVPGQTPAGEYVSNLTVDITAGP